MGIRVTNSKFVEALFKLCKAPNMEAYCVDVIHQVLDNISPDGVKKHIEQTIERFSESGGGVTEAYQMILKVWEHYYG